jgi:energy-coupling factor transporter ATP-binding protein EcfA2
MTLLKSISDERLVKTASLNKKYTGEEEEDFKNRLIEAEQCLDIVVAGQMKAGKTTFLNALLMLESDKELDTSGLPMTLAPWKLQWSTETQDYVNIFYAEGEQKRKKWNETKEIQKSNIKDIDYFEAFIASDVLNIENCIFWDTPGFNDPKKDDSKTLKFLSDHEVIIFVTGYSEHTKKVVVDDQEKEIIGHILSQNNSECIVILTNPGDNENFFNKKDDYCKEIKDHYFQKYKRQINVIPLESKCALSSQRELKKIVDEMSEAVYSFLKNKDISSYGKTDWTERIRKNQEAVKKSGIIEVRDAVKNITENKEILIVKSGRERIARDVEKIKKKIDEVLQQQTDEFEKAEKEKDLFIETLNPPKDEDLFNNETVVQKASSKIVRFLPEYFAEYKNNLKDKVQTVITTSKPWVYGWVKDMNKLAESEIPKFFKEQTKKIRTAMEEQYKEIFKKVLKDDLSKYAKKNNMNDDFMKETDILLEKQTLKKILDEISQSTSNQCLKIIKEKIDNKEKLKTPPLDEISKKVSDIFQKSLEKEIEEISKKVFPKYSETRTELKYEMEKKVKEDNSEELKRLEQKVAECNNKLNETKNDLSVLIDKKG